MTTLTPAARLLNTLHLILAPFIEPFLTRTRRPPVVGVWTPEPETTAAAAAPAPVQEAAPAAVEPAPAGAELPANPVAVPVEAAERVDAQEGFRGPEQLFVKVVKGKKAVYLLPAPGETPANTEMYRQVKYPSGATRYARV